MGMEDSSSFLIAVALISGLFLLLREFWCWFWKINERKDILNKILIQLQKQNSTKSTNFQTTNTHHFSNDKERTHAENVILANKIAKEKDAQENPNNF
ncbi:hypothetical protein HOE22_05995 [Candidatus Woesearchaeota archaeon]|jgi:hypothetical protein|nr:hypothetical protein [Candidatus Woesearchaeota archaeon]MBT5991927.1 hypothetical protein [Bacteroidota bacterium]